VSYVVEINDLPTLLAHRLAWEALLLQTRRASFFQTLDWLECYWRHFGAGQKLRVLVVYSDDKPIGILPLCVRVERYKIGPLRVLTYPLHDWGSYYGPVGPNPAATLLAGLRHVRQTERDWDLIDLRWIDKDGWEHGRTVRAMRQVGFAALQSPWKHPACIDLSGTWETYCAIRGGHWRSNLRRNERLLAQEGKVEYLRYRPGGAMRGDDDPRWDLYDACEAVAARSWQGASTDGTTLSHVSARPFLRAAHQRAARRGMLDLHLITIDEQPAAFAYNYAHQSRVQGLRIGSDPRFAHCGLGAVMLGRAIRDSFERGDAHYDLGPDYLRAKRPWLTHLETSYRYSHFPRLHLRAQALRAKRLLHGWWTRGEARENRAG
jgi:CelD/BcsL family acetyltransferase involved in cellulose biosynthesis